jgi:poly(A) polymerase
MIKKLIRRLLGRDRQSAAAQAPPQTVAPEAPVMPQGARTEVGAEEHRISAQLVDDNAVRVVRTLKDAGYEAYIVGGAVRDLLVGLRPKDFDVATDATPEQVKSLFRRAFIIGRRFRIVHVVFGRGREHEVIEVSTFRAYLDSQASETVNGNEKTAKAELSDRDHAVDASGRVLRDNVWGPQIEDAARRDFTVNAMYYDPVRRIVVDYHGGMADARSRVLRMIGDPAARYREDPVRILRAVRFAAKAGFAIEPATAAPIARMSHLLGNVPASRLFDEMIKLLQTGHALASLGQLQRHGLHRGVFPVLDAAFADVVADPTRHKFIELALADTDRRVAEGRAVAPSFLLACLLWHDVQTRWQVLRDAGEQAFVALQQAIEAVFDARIGDISGRGKLAIDMREIWLMQPRFERRAPSSAMGLIAQPRFRAGYDFLRLRSDVGEVPVALADWWEDFHLGNDEEREALLQAVREPKAVRRVPGPGKKASESAPKPQRVDVEVEAAPPPSGETDVGVAAESASAPRRRRRRRGKRSGGDAEGTPGAESSAGSEGG